ncbi:MAG TPA: FAD binding domain-containing protein [Elusimicrobiota bacterium]|nr:FAD binding domain-containing protein [Elusimicrobiota bacterium]
MKINDFFLPTKISEAYARLKKEGNSAWLMAGGTSTAFVKSTSPKTAIDLTRLPLRGITRKSDHFRIGACATVCDLMEYKAEGWVLDRVARRFVNQHVRNISTLGGNISRVFYWSDFPVALRALEGTLTMRTSKESKVKISEAFHNMLAHRGAFKDVILEYIDVPRLTKGMGFGYSKETRTSEGFSTATVAVFVKVDKGLISDVRIAAGSVFPFPMRFLKMEEALTGEKAEVGCIRKIDFKDLDRYALTPREGMTLDYCKHLLKVKISDGIAQAVAEATGGSR